MGSSTDECVTDSSNHQSLLPQSQGIIPRVIKKVFANIGQRERERERSKDSGLPLVTYTVRVQFLELYGEEIRDLLDHTKTSKVAIRETPAGEVYVSGNAYLVFKIIAIA